MLNAASRTLFAAIAAVALLPAMAAAQAVQRNPIQVSPSHFDISPPVREMVPSERPSRPAFLNPPRPLPRPQHSLVVDPVVQSTPSTPLMPPTTNNFPALRI